MQIARRLAEQLRKLLTEQQSRLVNLCIEVDNTSNNEGEVISFSSLAPHHENSREKSIFIVLIDENNLF